jgi:hypothetical protein
MHTFLPPRLRKSVGGLLAFFLFAWIVGVSSALDTATSSSRANESRGKSDDCQKRVISINAANGAVDWGLVEEAGSTAINSSYVPPWCVDEITLEGFGKIMKEQSFQSALDHFEPQLRDIFSGTSSHKPPDALIVSSKGVNIFTFLAAKGVWRGPSILLSPIPNACDHIDGNSWETEWKSTMESLVSHHRGPLGIGVGTSFDEQFLIVEMMEESGVCGKVKTNSFFETCPTWFLQSFEGTHSWKNDATNAPSVARLINKLLGMVDRDVQEPVGKEL